MMKRQLSFILMIILLVNSILPISCKKETNTKMISGGVIYQYGTNIPVEGVTVYLRRPGWWYSSNYKSVVTDAHGAFNIDNVTSNIFLHKNGFIGSHNNRHDEDLSFANEILPGGPFGASSIFYIDKIGWAKLHVINPEGKRIGTQILIPYSYLVSDILYGDNVQKVLTSGTGSIIDKYTDTTVTSIEIADAVNYIQLSFFHDDYSSLVAVNLDSFYVKSGDTAYVTLKIQ